eukprot:6056647-Alexandrium_andersonii.AAC.1
MHAHVTSGHKPLFAVICMPHQGTRACQSGRITLMGVAKVSHGLRDTLGFNRDALRGVVHVSQMAPKARPRASCDPETLAAVFRPHVRTPVWLRYGEKMDSQLNVPVLVAHRRWLSELWTIQANLAFSQSLLASTFRQLLKPEWNLTAEQGVDWVECMGRR